ncbi:MAG: hypothetical protein R3330_01365 [Saprospiraceae bacterium]|nr:hypothetical protein [Saprospiraceae bacterium]
MLLIHNLSQLLDAFNNCSIGLFDFDDVIQSAQVSVQDVLEEISKVSGGEGPILIHRTAEYQLHAILMQPADAKILKHLSPREWLYVVSGSIAFGDLIVEEQHGMQLPSATDGSTELKCRSAKQCVALHLSVN